MKLTDVITVTEAETNNWQLIQKMAAMLGYKISFQFVQGDFDREEAADDAVKICRLRKENMASFKIVMAALNSAANLLGGPSRGTFTQLDSTTEALSERVSMVSWFGEGIKAIQEMHQKAPAMAAHAAGVEQICDFISELDRLEPSDSEWGENYKLVNAFLKKLGVR